jgi:hypothetical protein
MKMKTTRPSSFLSAPRKRQPLPIASVSPYHQWKYILIGLCLLVLVLVAVRPFLYKEEIKIKKNRNTRRAKRQTTATAVKSSSTTAATSQKITTTSSPYPYDYMDPSFMDGCYSMRLVVPTYEGPVAKIEKNDGTQQDIYTDATQSYLTTGPNNQGMTLAQWLSSGVGKVRAWYDQSGNGNHALCYSYCPTISTLDSSKYVLKFQQYTDSGLRIDPVRPYSIFFQFWHDNNDPAKIISTDVDPSIGQYYGVVIQNGDINGNKSQYDWYYVAEGDKDFTVNQDDSPEYDLGEWNTVCLSVENPHYSANDKENLTLIGKDLTGYLSELILYNRPMDQNDMDAYNKNNFDVAD